LYIFIYIYYDNQTDSEGNEVVDALEKPWCITVVVEESLWIKLGRIIPVSVVEMNCLVVRDDNRLTRNQEATEWCFLLSRVWNAERNCEQTSRYRDKVR